jgi:hypothetical protein
MALSLPPSPIAGQQAAVDRAAEDQSDALADSLDLDLELKRLAAEHQKLLDEMGLTHPAAPAQPANGAARPMNAPTGKKVAPAAEVSFMEKFRQENARLAARVAELEYLLEATESAPHHAGQPEGSWDERQQEYELMLAEKCETIRELRVELLEYKDQPQTVAPKEAELVQLSEQLEEDRRQLQEDEAALEEQTKQMEMNIARQRAEIARQRTEVERMFSELRLELEQAMREGGLRERLTPLQRRSQEFAVRAGFQGV